MKENEWIRKKVRGNEIPQAGERIRLSIRRFAAYRSDPPAEASLAQSGLDLGYTEITTLIPVISPAVPDGLPADILRRHPGMRKAEHQPAAQTACVDSGPIAPRMKIKKIRGCPFHWGRGRRQGIR